MWKNIRLASDAGIQTHNLLNMGLFLLLQYQASHFISKF